MDAIVEKALAKWPNVPHCYGWLALDARGNWRMRDEQAQHQNLPGERIQSPALLGFIRRNYAHDEQGCWYFQNGPQRVYVDLEITPHIARTDPALGFVVHTGQSITNIDAIWLTDSGRFLLQADDRLAMLDDRDMAECLPQLRLHQEVIDDAALLQWLDQEGKEDSALIFTNGPDIHNVHFIKEDELEQKFGFVRQPRPANTN